MLGSCFSDNIGARLADDLFHVTVNPMGTLYNPLSVLRCVETLSQRRDVVPGSLLPHEGRWHHYMFHSRFSRLSPEDALDGMNRAIHNGADALAGVDIVIITLGSTRVFRLRDTGDVVTNCHKQPSDAFIEEELGVDAVADALDCTVAAIRRVNPAAKVLLTVSPIRHMASGLSGNSLSKATLRVAVARSVEKHSGVYYFPSYEIMLDDLRDYRFYAADMKHPSDVAVEYIYGVFMDSTMHADTIAAARECRPLSRRMRHRASPGSPPDSSLASLISSLTVKYPYITDLL